MPRCGRKASEKTDAAVWKEKKCRKNGRCRLEETDVSDWKEDRMEKAGISSDMIEKLCGIAVKMREKSYTPYSHFRVGAALLGRDGQIFTGCNVENAAYTVCTCAERTAFVKAVSEGVREFTALAICGGHERGALEYCLPCGVCRQVMAEFCEGHFPVYLAKSADDYIMYTLDELMPNRFTPESLKL